MLLLSVLVVSTNPFYYNDCGKLSLSVSERNFGFHYTSFFYFGYSRA